MFKISEISEAPEGTVGIIKDAAGKPVQAFLKKQFGVQSKPESPVKDPTWMLTESVGYGLECLIEGVEPNEPKSFMVLTEDSAYNPMDFSQYENHEDEAVYEEFLDEAKNVLASLPEDSVVLTGDIATPFSSFTLAIKQGDKWSMSGCGGCRYEYADGSIVTRLVSEETIDGTANMEFEGSVHVYPYTLDTQIR